MRILSAHRGPVRAVAYSPDGAWLATGGDDRQVLLWELRSGQFLRRLQGHSDWVRDLAFSPAGMALASASWDNDARVWDLRRRPKCVVHPGHDGGAWSVAISPDAPLTVSGAGDGTVWFHRDRQAPPIARRVHRGPVSALTFTPTGGTLVSASHDRTINLWDSSWTRVQTTLELHRDWVCSVAVSSDGQFLASSDAGGAIVVTTLPDRKEATRWQEHTGPVAQVAFLRHGMGLLSVGWDGTVRQWDVRSRQQQHAYAWEAGRLLCLAVAPDGMTAAAGAENGEVVVWDLEE